MKKNRILVYVREYFKDEYLKIFSSMNCSETEYLTDFPTAGMKNVRDLFYAELERYDLNRDVEFDVQDVISRCRFLRNIEPLLAAKLAKVMYLVMVSVIEQSQCDFVFGQAVDDYITHVLSIAADARGKKYIGICSPYFSGYTLVTEYSNGKPICAREVDENEARAVIKKISGKDFRMDYANPKNYSFPLHVKKVVKYQLKEILFFLLKYYRRDPINYHYNVQRFLSQPKSIFNYPDRTLFHEDWLARLKTTKFKLVYFPLSVFPEATTDYWVSHKRFIDYENTVLNIASDLSKSNLVIIKEHAHMLGIRSNSFYEKMKRLPNVVSVPPQVISNWILEEFRPVVLVGTGSVGIEATLRGLPVVTFSSSSYWFESSGASYVAADRNADICNAVANATPSGVTPVQFIQECLKSTLPFDYMRAKSVDSLQLEKISQFFKI